MTKKILKFAPLIYVQLEITWRPLPRKSVLVEEAREEYFSDMQALGFLNKSYEQPIHGFNLSDSEAIVSKSELTRLLSTTPDKYTQVELANNRLAIKQGKYTGFENLLRLAESVLEILQKFQDIKTAGIDVISLHYVDLILPSKGKCLEDYIIDNQKAFIPHQPIIANEKILSSNLINTTVALLEKNEIKVRDIATRFHSLKQDKNRFPRFIPDELLEPIPEAAISMELPRKFKIEELDDSGNYGILDIRHGVRLFKNPQLKDVNVLEEARSLYHTASSVFWDLLSSHAKDEWEMYQTTERDGE